MEKKIIVFFLLLSTLRLSAQKDSNGVSHSAFISFDNWFWYDTHTIYGYNFTKGKHSFSAGFSIERKRLPTFYFGYNEFVFRQSLFVSPYILKDTNFSLTTNCIKFGYNYIRKTEKRLAGGPFVNLFVNFYRNKGEFTGPLGNGVYGTDQYYMSQWQLLGNFGYGFRYKMNEKIHVKMDIGIGTSFINNYFDSEYFETSANWSWWTNGFGSLGVYYRFK
jgi:hypothetical protein